MTTSDTTTETPATVATMTDRMRLVLDARIKLIRRRTVGRSPGAAEIARANGWTAIWVSKGLKDLAEAGLLDGPPREGPQEAPGGPRKPRPSETARAAKRASADARRAQTKAEAEALANAAKSRREKAAADARRRKAELAADRARERAEAREARTLTLAEARDRRLAREGLTRMDERWPDASVAIFPTRTKSKANRASTQASRGLPEGVAPGYGKRTAKRPYKWTTEDQAVWEARPVGVKKIGDVIPGTSVMVVRTPTGIDAGWTLVGKLGLGSGIEGEDDE
jgi:hypothetical protein